MDFEGQCLDEKNLHLLLKFCVDNDIMLMADEVYQENIYNSEKPFVSARAALASMDDAYYKDKAEIVSFHTTSKGFLGKILRRNIHDIRRNQFSIYSLNHATICIIR